MAALLFLQNRSSGSGILAVVQNCAWSTAGCVSAVRFSVSDNGSELLQKILPRMACGHSSRWCHAADDAFGPCSLQQQQPPWQSGEAARAGSRRTSTAQLDCTWGSSSDNATAVRRAAAAAGMSRQTGRVDGPSCCSNQHALTVSRECVLKSKTTHQPCSTCRVGCTPFTCVCCAALLCRAAGPSAQR
jgi:hypothetical protein